MVTWEEFKEKMFEKNKTFELDYKAIEMKYKVIDMLESYLKNNNITQQEFADRIGTTQQMISKFLTGKVNKNSDFIFKILIVIGAEIVKKNEIRVFSISIREEQIIDLKKIEKVSEFLLESITLFMTPLVIGVIDKFHFFNGKFLQIFLILFVSVVVSITITSFATSFFVKIFVKVAKI